MSTRSLKQEIQALSLRIILLSDALKKYSSEIRLNSIFLNSTPPNVSKSEEDLKYLQLKKRYLEFLLIKGIK